MSKKESPEKKYDWQDTLWVLALGGQAGLLIAFPVLIGLGLGFYLDRRLDTLPWLTLILTLMGMVGGPVLVYRWVQSTVRERLENRFKEKLEED